MALSYRQVIPRLRKLLQSAGLHCEGNHTHKVGASRVDLFLPGNPSMVVHRCVGPVIAGVEALKRHVPPSERSPRRACGHRVSSRHEPPLVFALVTTKPTPAKAEKLAWKNVEFAVLDPEITEEDIARVAERIRAVLEFARHERSIRLSRVPSAAMRGARGRGGYAQDPVTTLTRRFDQLRSACDALLSGNDAEHVERELALAEDELASKHYPACMLHVARAAEGLVLHLADCWDARPDGRLLGSKKALRDGVDLLATTLLDPEHDVHKARNRAVKLVDQILEMLLSRAGDGDACGESERTIATTLNDIKRRWRKLDAVRNAVKDTHDDPRCSRFLELRNAIAHARPSGRDNAMDADGVVEMIDGALALIEHLSAMRKAIDLQQG